jgi:hypothetical protein
LVKTLSSISQILIKLILTPLLLIRSIRAKISRSTPRRASAAAPLNVAIAPAPMSNLLSSENQWGRVSRVVEQSVARSHEIRDSQGAARQQLDAAEYALTCLLQELQVVMPAMARLKAVEQPPQARAAFRPALAA